MKFLVVGLGSMGKRRVRNLLANGVPVLDIVGVDQRSDRAKEALQKYHIHAHSPATEEDIAAADVIIISTSPDQHLPYAQLAAKHGKPMFIEASVLDEGLDELAKEVRAKKLIAFPSCTMRFFPAQKRIQELLKNDAIGRVLVWQYQSGQYLPDWHPWEKITDFYVSNPPTGACREIVPFELVWLIPTFGDIAEIDARHEKLSDLPAPIDDIYMLQIKHQNGALGQLIVDVLGRSPVRSLRITGTEGTLEWDDGKKMIRVYRASTGVWEEEPVGHGTVEAAYINPEEPYIEEIRTFLECVKNGTPPLYTLEDDIQMLHFLYRAERSAANQRRVILSDSPGIAKTDDNSKMRFYEVSVDEFYDRLGVAYPRHEHTMGEMVDRYDIHKRKVLAVGAGYATQEYWFLKHGNQLLLIDIDELGAIEPVLKTMAKPPASKPSLTYAVGDARRISDYMDHPFDVLFLSSFAPDELRRQDIVANSIAESQLRKDENVIIWPLAAQPFSEVTMEIARALPRGGLFISLSYMGGPDVTAATTYVPALQAQLKSEGMTLLELHYMQEAPGVNLVVALKETRARRVNGYVKALKKRPPITQIHARAEIPLTSLTAFSLTQDPQFNQQRYRKRRPAA